MKRFVKIKLMIYHYFCCWIKVNWRKFNFVLFVSFNNVFPVTWYLKPFPCFNKSLNKSLMLYLLVSNWINGSFFFSINWALYGITYPLNAWSLFITPNSSQRSSSKSKLMFFKRLMFALKFFEIVYYIWLRFNFLMNCHFYILR